MAEFCFSPWVLQGFRHQRARGPSRALRASGIRGNRNSKMGSLYHPSRVVNRNRLCLPLGCLTGLYSSPLPAPLLCAPVSSLHRLEQKPLFSSLFRLRASMRLGKAVVFRACVEANRARAPEMWPPPGGLCVLVHSLSEGAGRQDCGRLQTRVSRKSALSGPVGEGGLPTGWLLHFRRRPGSNPCFSVRDGLEFR